MLVIVMVRVRAGKSKNDSGSDCHSERNGYGPKNEDAKLFLFDFLAQTTASAPKPAFCECSDFSGLLALPTPNAGP